MSSPTPYYLGLDVGTGSARAGIFDAQGQQAAAASRPIQLWRPSPDFAEQSSQDIWRACCGAVRAALGAAGLSPRQIRSVGFDATCSLVALDAQDRPVTVSPTGRDEQNVIVWMDHRALGQAERINRLGHAVLRYVGGVISPEMQAPKLLWLKEELPLSWQRAARLFDLPDFLVYRATGDETRSLCSTVCKWTYLGHEGAGTDGSLGRWDPGFFREIGLGDLAEEGFRRIGRRVRPQGEAAGRGLTAQAAEELGLEPGTAVGISIIDAHAGALGVLGACLPGQDAAAVRASLDQRLALIGGTSSCHMAVSPEPRFIPGVWGPYYSALIPGLWLTEGGQSATGALVDHVIFSHARGAQLQGEAQARGTTVYQLLNERLELLTSQAQLAHPALLTSGLHLLPYFHGNRSPLADPTLRGSITGLRLGDSVDELALHYLAALQAIALGTRHILEALNARGYRIGTLFVCGGGTRNPLLLRAHSDATGCRVALPREPEAVLLGAALLGAVAAGDFPSVTEAMAALNAAGTILESQGTAVARYYQAKYAVFRRLHEDQLAYRQLMAGAGS